jgi:hypothetical protein
LDTFIVSSVAGILPQPRRDESIFQRMLRRVQVEVGIFAGADRLMLAIC